ncbi:DNA-directed RNA polymerase I subunit RPA49-like [Sinocyclocheilus rhinocerous]|uniref:DNA-directed RNA polymerase I subunit RPA49-like n=1 Tax=Sinocyclocheilus rhinocerous TaxID=307959 RepID=UPI0007B9A58A|nr:PREDICTED: DNA-directed RNA polymerase I subunit RPA49-like [Sinocyclocheilus rhinocerous]
MAATCSWEPCEETGQDALIVKFSNGHVKKAEELDFKLFKHSDGINPRKKTRRIVVAESDRLPYVGSNFGSGSLQCNNLCRCFVGVLDKRTMKMKVHNAQLFNMLPVIPGESAVNENTKQADTYREKVDALIEAFGTTKQKRALSSRRLNEVGNETLQQAVALAATNVINQKGVEALRNEVVETEAQTDTALFLPSCNTEADKAEDVYPFDQLLSPNEFDSLKDVGAKMAALTPEDLLKMRAENCPQTVLRHLEFLPKEDAARDRQSRCAWYLSFLIKASLQKRLSFKFGIEDGCPRVIIHNVLKNFTVESFHHGSLRNTVSSSMRMKLVAHCLALLLHMGDQTANLTLLHRDMGISDAKMLEVAKAMGLTLSRQSAHSREQAGTQEEHRMASLVLPLVHYEQRMDHRKRKRMN